MKKLMVAIIGALLFTSLAWGITAPYVYKFPKPDTDWGNAVAFSNLSPGFFQVMYQNKAGVVRIATYGIMGASMDKLKDPQLMMVFAFDQSTSVSKVEYQAAR